jgi:hypothetical protein
VLASRRSGEFTQRTRRTTDGPNRTLEYIRDLLHHITSSGQPSSQTDTSPSQS